MRGGTSKREIRFFSLLYCTKEEDDFLLYTAIVGGVHTVWSCTAIADPDGI